MEAQYEPMTRLQRFQCPSCGHHRCERVVIQRAGKKPYVTEFVACRACRVMLWPAQEDLMRAPPSRSFGGTAGEQR
jgi:hypothetical protein